MHDSYQKGPSSSPSDVNEYDKGATAVVAAALVKRKVIATALLKMIVLHLLRSLFFFFKILLCRQGERYPRFCERFLTFREPTKKQKQIHTKNTPQKKTLTQGHSVIEGQKLRVSDSKSKLSKHTRHWRTSYN